MNAPPTIVTMAMCVKSRRPAPGLARCISAMRPHYNPMVRHANPMVRHALVAAVLMAATAHALAQSSSTDDPPDILISRQLAAARAIHVGDVVRVSRDHAASSTHAFRVAGIYEPTPDPTRINAAKYEARFHLLDLLAPAGNPDDPMTTDNVDAISTAVRPGVDPTAYARTLAGRVPGISAHPVADLSTQANLYVVLERFHLAIAVVTIVASTVFLLALAVM